LVAVADEDVDVVVALLVLFPASVVVCGRPVRTNCESDVAEAAVPEEFPTMIVSYPKMVVDPTVEVRVVDPVVTKDITGTVLMADEAIVRVEA
jgi:hypothetical protein